MAEVSLEDMVDEVREKLDRIRDKAEDIENLKFERDEALQALGPLRDRLVQAADILAEHGLITNTPHAKNQWVEYGKGLNA